MTSMKPGIIALLLFACTVAANAQDSSDVRRGEKISFLSMQLDLAFLLLEFWDDPLIMSIAWTQDFDFVVKRTSASRQSRFGIQIGINKFNWPDMTAEPKSRSAHGYSAVDYDLLGRYTWLTSRIRYDVTAGLTLRDGEYYQIRQWHPYQSIVSLGFKVGGAVTVMLIRPVLGIRLRGSMFFFGNNPVEAGAIGLGLVVGWQRSPEDG
jgi:hypothetical protein